MDILSLSKQSGAADDDDWYEHGFARVDGSRKRGVTSMPMPSAQLLMKWASYVPGSDLSGWLVIDPACGSGNTLLAATQALAARGRVRRWGAERVAQEIEQCIWGLDPDPVACHVADLRLRRLIAQIIPDLPSARRKALQLHIHQTDSLMLPVDGRFKLVISNPPLASARGVVVSYGDFEGKTPPRDVWLRFLEQSMRLVAYDGALAMALPEAFLIKPAAAALRDELRREWAVEHLAHVTGVYRSGSGTVLLMARRTPPTPEALLRWERVERLVTATREEPASDEHEITDEEDAVPSPPKRNWRAEHRLKGEIAQSTLAHTATDPWRYALGHDERAFVERMQQPRGSFGKTRLGEIAQVLRGAEMVREAPEPSATPIAGGTRLLHASKIAAYAITGDDAWLPQGAFKNDVEMWRAPKLVLPRASGRTIAALDAEGRAPHGAVIAIAPQSADPAPGTTLALLLALLNSPPVRAYVALVHTAYQLARPTLDLDVLRTLPIPLGPADIRARLVGLVEELARHQASTHPSVAVAHRVETAIGLEALALYSLTPEDQAVVARWA